MEIGDVGGCIVNGRERNTKETKESSALVIYSMVIFIPHSQSMLSKEPFGHLLTTMSETK